MCETNAYLVKDGEIVIIDEFTGRLMPGRRWSDGLHQAVEAKEGVMIRNENQDRLHVWGGPVHHLLLTALATRHYTLQRCSISRVSSTRAPLG